MRPQGTLPRGMACFHDYGLDRGESRVLTWLYYTKNEVEQ